MAVAPTPLSTQLQAALEAAQQGDAAKAQRTLLEAARGLLTQAQVATAPATRRALLEQADRLRARADALAPQVEAQQSMRRAQEEAARRAAPALSESDDVPPWLLAERPKERLADVAGLDDAKQQVHLKLIYPFTHPAAAERFGVAAGGGVLLFGPPGTGKTFFARAVAGELDAAFFAARGSSIMSQWVGKAEQNVAALFDTARSHPKAVIFLDEIEALLGVRGATSSSVTPRVVAEFLDQMQGVGHSSKGALLVLGATNLPWAVDPAALRPGRFDSLIYVGLPNEAARLRLFELNLANRPLDPTLDVDELVRRTDGFSGADMADLCLRAAQRAFLDEVLGGIQRTITQSDFDAALLERAPSVSRDTLRRLEKFRHEHESRD